MVRTLTTEATEGTVEAAAAQVARYASPLPSILVLLVS